MTNHRYFSVAIFSLVCCSLFLASCNSGGQDDREDTSPVHYSFSDLANWDAFDPGEGGLGTDLKGYVGSVFDGRYMYMVRHTTTRLEVLEKSRVTIPRPPFRTSQVGKPSIRAKQGSQPDSAVTTGGPLMAVTFTLFPTWSTGRCMEK